MKITKFVHSCLLVETPDRAAIFDPGAMSAKAIDVSKLERLDDIFITHVHQDHMDVSLIQQLVDKFPDVRITSNPEVVAELAKQDIKASDEAPPGVSFFEAPHENVGPLYPQPQERGIHYLDVLSDPGDSHSFIETKTVLALPVTAPWGGFISAMALALKLKPKHVLPIHDWHWSEEARQQSYDMAENLLAKEGIKFHKLKTAQPVEIEV